MGSETKCAACRDSGWMPSELGGSVPCDCGARPNLGVLDATPTPAADGEAALNAVLARLPHGATKWCNADVPAGCEHCVATARSILVALRARPLPDDVRAAVTEKARLFDLFDSACARVAENREDVRVWAISAHREWTLREALLALEETTKALAHLQRTEG